MPIPEKLLEQLTRLHEIGIALSKEKDLPTLLEKILFSAMQLTHSDGGTIYFVTADKKLRFEIAASNSLGFHRGGTSGVSVDFPELPLFLESGEPNDHLMVAYAVNHKKTINIKDAYSEKGFDFSGTIIFDKNTGYHTQSVLTIPMKNHEDEVIGVLQLINPLDSDTGEIKPFEKDAVNLAESLASQAGISLTNQLLIRDFKNLFESLVRVISEAVDAMSPTTGNHSKRVPILAAMLAQAVSESMEGPFKDVCFSKEEIYELEMAAFLHDCGKITTPIYLLEKRTKLEGIFDKIGWIRQRLDFYKSQFEVDALTKKIQWLASRHPDIYRGGEIFFNNCDDEKERKIKQLEEIETFLSKCNDGNFQMTEESLEKLKKINSSFDERWPILTDDELDRLSIKSGNLTTQERQMIKNHVVMTYKMLSQLKYPKELKRVPEIAASHHEKMDGTGYPRGLKGSEMSLQARILILADVFEALSAPDRSYKEPYPLSQIIGILKNMAQEGHLDPDLLDVFLQKKIYLKYGARYLMSEQMDID